MSCVRSIEEVTKAGSSMKGDLGWVKLWNGHHEPVKYAGKLRAMDGSRWPKVVP